MQQRTHSFGYWLRRRRKALDLTQEALAERVFCSGFTIRKIEADERRPSRQLAHRLADSLVAVRRRAPGLPRCARGRSAPPNISICLSHPPPGRRLLWLQPESASAADFAPFVGRGNEFGLLIGLVARLTAGVGHVVLIEGEPGIGKSRLMREVARYAHAQDLQTLATNCYEIERAIPYQPVIDLVTRALDRASPTALRKLAPVSLAELAALVPTIAERFPGLPQLVGRLPRGAAGAPLPRAWTSCSRPRAMAGRWCSWWTISSGPTTSAPGSCTISPATPPSAPCS